MDVDRMEHTRQVIYETVLNVARLRCHGCYLEEGVLTFVSHDALESHIQMLLQELEHRAKNVLMTGDWR